MRLDAQFWVTIGNGNAITRGQQVRLTISWSWLEWALGVLHWYCRNRVRFYIWLPIVERDKYVAYLLINEAKLSHIYDSDLSSTHLISFEETLDTKLSSHLDHNHSNTDINKLSPSRIVLWTAISIPSNRRVKSMCQHLYVCDLFSVFKWPQTTATPMAAFTNMVYL